MKLTPEIHAYVAQRAQWYVDISTMPRGVFTAGPDNTVFTGDGLEDINQLIGFVHVNPTCRMFMEVGSAGTITLGNAWPKYLQCDLEDLYQLKEQYIAYYGSVNKPEVWIPPEGGAVPIYGGGKTWP